MLLWKREANSSALSATNFGCMSQLFAVVCPDVFSRVLTFFLPSTGVDQWLCICFDFEVFFLTRVPVYIMEAVVI